MSNINVNNLTPLLGSGSSVSVSGSLVVKNDVTIGGHLYIGDADTDSVTFSAEVSSSILPDANITYDLGSQAKQWRTIYLNSLVVKHITASGNISASGTGVNGTGSFHHVYSNGEILASGTGSFDQGMIASNSSSLTYASMSGALVTSYHISASRGLFTATGSTQVGLEVYHTASIGYISASGDMTMSGTASFGGGIDALNASGSFQYVHVEENISGSASGSLNDLFVNDAVEIQGVTVIHGNISSSNNVSASFGYVSSSGDISASGTGSFAAGIVTDGTATGSFGYISASGDVSSAGTGSFFGGVDAAAATGSFGYVSASGDISTSTAVRSVQYYTDSLLALTGDQSLNTVKLGGGTSVTQLHGLSIDVSGSVSMSGVLHTQLNGNGALPTIDNDTVAIFQRNLPGNSSAAVSIIGHAAGESIVKLGDTDDEDIGRIRYQHTDNSMDFHTNNTQQMSIDSSGNVEIVGSISSSGRVSASAGFETDAGTTSNFGTISMSGALVTAGEISASRVSASLGFEADTLSTSSFGNVSASGNISTSAHMHAVQYYTDSLLFATGDQATNTVKLGGGASVTQLHGLSIDVTGSVSMSGALSMSGANADIITEGAIYGLGNISSSALIAGRSATFASAGINALTITTAGAVSASSTLAGTALTLATNGVNALTISTAGAVSASSTIAGTALTLATTGTTYASIDALGTGSFLGGIDCIGDAKNATGSFGYISCSEDVSSSGTVFGETLTAGTRAVIPIIANGSGDDIVTLGTTPGISVLGASEVIGNLSSSAILFGTALTVTTNGVHKASIDASGNVAAEGTISSSGVVSGTALTLATNGVNALTVTTAGALSASSTLAGTALDIKTAGVTKATIAADGTGSFTTVSGKMPTDAQANSSAINLELTEAVYPSRTVISVDQRTGNNAVAYTLPAATKGLEYTFIATQTSTGTGTTTIKAASTDLAGMAICKDANEHIYGTNFIFAATKFEQGTRVHCISDGTIWQINAFCPCDVADISTT